MQALAQQGFDFGESTVVFEEHPACCWNDPIYTSDEYQQLLSTAEEGAAKLPGILGALFQTGIERVKLSHAEQVIRMGEGAASPHRLWGKTDYKVSLDVLNQCCESANSLQAETILRMSFHCTTTAIHIKNVGTLVAHVWPGRVPSLQYVPWRATALNPSYRDNRVRHQLNEKVWMKACCCEGLSRAESDIAKVPSFAYLGRSYICTGVWSHGSLRACDGWTFLPLSDWQWSTFSYSELRQAWDAGTVERGDMRGLLVMVRGTRCVIDGFAEFFDPCSKFYLPIHETADE